MKISILFQWLILVGLSIVSFIIGFDFCSNEKLVSAILFSILGILFVVISWYMVRKRITETEKLITAISKKDFTLFPKQDSTNPLKNEAVKLYYQSKAENLNLTSYKQLYENILGKLEIGFLILQQKANTNTWTVFYSNQAFLSILEVPKYNDWEFYKTKTPNFFNLIEETQYMDSQDFIDIALKEGSKESYSIRTSRISSPDQIFCVISLESVQKIIERKEKLAWNNLMKVISHELLNTLTPVNSLIHNMEYLTEQEKMSRDDQQEMKESLKIVNSKSQQLLHFIDSYRQIAELPKPKKEEFDLKPTIENVLKIFETEFSSKQISLKTKLQHMIISADEKMIERVLVNLITNSIHALEHSDYKEIIIKNHSKNHRQIVTVKDSGEGIDQQIQDKIYMPFFTTRQNGSGIGLTLAKSIMEAHNGYLTHRNSEENGSVFEIWLM